MICERCGVTLQIGDYPFCKGCPDDHHGRRGGIVTDEIPGGQVIENLGPVPVRVFSHSERLRIASEQGLREPTKADLPFSRSVTDWATIDPKTLENAQVLVTRRVWSPEGDDPDAQVTVRPFNEVGTDADALRRLAETHD